MAQQTLFRDFRQSLKRLLDEQGKSEIVKGTGISWKDAGNFLKDRYTQRAEQLKTENNEIARLASIQKYRREQGQSLTPEEQDFRRKVELNEMNKYVDMMPMGTINKVGRSVLPVAQEGLQTLGRQLNPPTGKFPEIPGFPSHYDTSKVIPIKSNEKIVGGMEAFRDRLNPQRMRVSKVMVSPEEQGKGLGTQAVNQLFKDNPDINEIVGHATDEARSFWLKQGAKFSEGSSAFNIKRSPVANPSKADIETGNKGVYPKGYEDFIKRNRKTAVPFDYDMMEIIGSVPESKGNMVKVYRMTTNGKLLPGDNVSIYDFRKFPEETLNKMGITPLLKNKDAKMIEEWIPKEALYQTDAGTQLYAPKGIKSAYDAVQPPKDNATTQFMNRRKQLKSLKGK